MPQGISAQAGRNGYCHSVAINTYQRFQHQKRLNCQLKNINHRKQGSVLNLNKRIAKGSEELWASLKQKLDDAVENGMLK